jgi:hypothetical protein
MEEFDEKTFKIEASYRFDAFLMHLVQDTTKRSSADILNFFHELGRQVSEMGFIKNKGRGIRKEMHDYFPGTSIPFHMLVKGHKSYGRWDYSTNKQIKADSYWCSVEVGFPSQITSIKEEELQNISVGLMEKALLDGGEVVVAPFVRPEIKTPKMYIALMNAFAGRPEPEKKRRKKKIEVVDGENNSNDNTLQTSEEQERL